MDFSDLQVVVHPVSTKASSFTPSISILISAKILGLFSSERWALGLVSPTLTWPVAWSDSINPVDRWWGMVNCGVGYWMWMSVSLGSCVHFAHFARKEFQS